MTRGKVKLQLIENETARKATFRKRQKGILKKVGELSTLCDVDACAIIYGPGEAKPHVWPNESGVCEVLAKYKSVPVEDREKVKLDQEAYLARRVEKATEALEKLQAKNREMEMENLMAELVIGNKTLEGLSLKDFRDLSVVVDKTIGKLTEKVAYLERKGSHASASSNPCTSNSYAHEPKNKSDAAA